LASERGIALVGLSGGGPGSAILYADVERAAAGAAFGPASTKRLDLKEMRRAIAAAMARLKREIPHYYLSTTVDLTRALASLEAANATRSPAQRLLLAGLLLKAVARALGEAPEFNMFSTAEGFEPGSGIDIGTAIAIRGGGLIARLFARRISFRSTSSWRGRATSLPVLAAGRCAVLSCRIRRSRSPTSASAASRPCSASSTRRRSRLSALGCRSSGGELSPGKLPLGMF
jgi:2-oxoacid dehydrogenases acyltransferase (catalytic domain)